MTDLNELKRRIEQLEDAAAFTERNHDQFNEVLTDLGQRVVALTARIKKLDLTLEGLASRVGEFDDRGTEAPPHSAGPDISRDPL